MSMLEKIKKVVQRSPGNKKSSEETASKYEPDDSQPPTKKKSKMLLNSDKARKKAVAVDKFETQIIESLKSVAGKNISKEEMTAYATSGVVQESQINARSLSNPRLLEEYVSVISHSQRDRKELLDDNSPAERSIVPHEEKEMAQRAAESNRRNQKRKQKARSMREAKLRSTMPRQEYEELKAKLDADQNLTEEELNKRRVNKTGPAVQYILQWKNDRANWTFKKSFQTRMLKFMYKPEEEGGVPDEHFETFMEYCETVLSEQSKKRTKDEATAILEEGKDDFKMKRADIVAKSLSDVQVL